MTIKEINKVLEEGNALKSIAQIFSDIANLKIKRIRGEVERNRTFFEEISYVYGLIKQLANKKGLGIKKGKKTISLILTSNYHFFGNINSDLIDFFVSTTAKMETDRLIIGKTAIDYFKTQLKLNKLTPNFNNYQEIVLKEDMPSTAELKKLVGLTEDYQQILIFFPKLKSLLIQLPEILDLSTTQKSIVDSSQIDFKFIFEPELPKVLAFFDSQIITLLLEEAFLESELSRTASRFISMDNAETEANKFIKEYTKIKAYAKRNLDNNTILEDYATMMAVRNLHG